jgi:hypothetical protein
MVSQDDSALWRILFPLVKLDEKGLVEMQPPDAKDPPARPGVQKSSLAWLGGMSSPFSRGHVLRRAQAAERRYNTAQGARSCETINHFQHRGTETQCGLRPQPKFQISNSRSCGENDSSEGKSLRAAKKFTVSRTRLFRDRARKEWPLPDSPPRGGAECLVAARLGA